MHKKLLALACFLATALAVSTASAQTVVDVRVAAGDDDAEERADGSMYLTSSDLELVFDGGGDQTVGMRFNGVDIPQGAAILNAFVQFKVDETPSNLTNLVIEGEAVDHAATFTSSSGNISSRPRTTAAVSWSPPAWPTVGEAGPDQQTPDIAPVIQEIVNRPAWSSLNSLVIMITGTGERTAESFNGDQAGAPLLYVEYLERPPPTVTITAPADGTTVTEGDSVGFTGTATDTEDGDLTWSLAWTSSLDGSIGSGGSFSTSPFTLLVGTHTITASVTDSDGAAGSAQIGISVTTLGGNLPPTVSSGADQTIGLFENAILDGTVSDDGLPNPPGMATTTWSQFSGPGTVTFTDASAVDTTASVSEAGTYVLELTADDGELIARDEVTITVIPGSIIRVPLDVPTIQAGIDAALDGDLVLVAPGTYTENLTLSARPSPWPRNSTPTKIPA